MATAKGRTPYPVAAFRRTASNSWGTAISLTAAGHGLILNEAPDFLNKPEQLPDEAMGFEYKEYIDAGNKIITPAPNMDLRYDGALWRMVAQAIGGDSSATATSGASGTLYNHTMDVTAENAGLFGTFCVFDGITVREIPSFKPSGFTLSGESGGFWLLTVRGMGDDCLLSGQTNSGSAAGVNGIIAATATSKVLRVPYGATAFRINDQSGGALASGDVLYPNSINFEFDRDMRPNFLANNVADGSGNEWSTLEPDEDGVPTGILTVTFPKYTAVTHLEDLGDETVKKADITIQGPTPTGYGGDYDITISLPALRIVDVTPDPSGSTKIIQSITCEMLKAQTAPTGMTGITNMFRMVVANLSSEDFGA
jgi:hypothetical protein